MSGIKTHTHYRKRSAGAHRAATGFVLFEVMVAMAILGVSVAMLMNGFTTAFRSIDFNNQATIGMALTQRLLDEYEFDPPLPGPEEGHFGETFPDYTWKRDVWVEGVNYQSARSGMGDNELSEMIMVHVQVFHEPVGKPRSLAFEAYTALTQAEKFSRDAKMFSGLFAHNKNR